MKWILGIVAACGLVALWPMEEADLIGEWPNAEKEVFNKQRIGRELNSIVDGLPVERVIVSDLSRKSRKYANVAIRRYEYDVSFKSDAADDALPERIKRRIDARIAGFSTPVEQRFISRSVDISDPHGKPAVETVAQFESPQLREHRSLRTSIDWSAANIKAYSSSSYSSYDGSGVTCEVSVPLSKPLLSAASSYTIRALTPDDLNNEAFSDYDEAQKRAYVETFNRYYRDKIGDMFVYLVAYRLDIDLAAIPGSQDFSADIKPHLQHGRIVIDYGNINPETVRAGNTAGIPLSAELPRKCSMIIQKKTPHFFAFLENAMFVGKLRYLEINAF